jgi:hypothetical protein
MFVAFEYFTAGASFLYAIDSSTRGGGRYSGRFTQIWMSRFHVDGRCDGRGGVTIFSASKYYVRFVPEHHVRL